MSEIDISKCKFYCEKYDGCYCFNSSKEVYAVNPNEHNSCEANKDCYYKQLQQLQAENEKLCTVIRNELPEQYDKRISEAESDIEWGVLDRNATESEFCKNVILETRNYITKLKAENDELRNKNNAIHSIADDLQQRNHNLTLENEELHRRQNVFNIFKKIDKYKQCLDEIEKLCKEITKEDICVECNHYETQDRCYECDYEHHRQELYYKRTKYNIALDILQLIKQAKKGKEE